MNLNKFLKSISIFLGIAFIFLVQNTEFSTYSSYLLAILIIFSSIYISLKKRSASRSELFSGQPLELFGLSSIIVLIISITSGLASPLFFFLYFFLFILAFIAPSEAVWVFLASIILFFIPQIMHDHTSDVIVKIGSLVLLSPIAYFIGREFERRELLAKKIDDKTDEIIQNAANIKETRGLTNEEDEAIDEIIEEAQSLKDDTEN
jgi:hypothetical protein